MASLKASLDIFDRAGIRNLLIKSRSLTAYLEELIKAKCQAEPKDSSVFRIKIISPSSPKERGCQLSLHVKQNGKKLFEMMHQAGFIVDYRNPDVIRIAPTPLYNSFEDIYKVVDFMKDICHYDTK
jgi:kynureninase